MSLTVVKNATCSESLANPSSVGTVVDGELVVVQDGRADFRALLRRHQRQQPDLLRAAVFRAQPAVTYVLFDLLFHQGQSLLTEALIRRRALLRELLLQINEPALVYSDGVEGCGREDLFTDFGL